MINNGNNNNKPETNTRNNIPVYPRNGDCHYRIPLYEWNILEMVCKSRDCGINEAICFVIRTHISRTKDPEIIADMLINIGANIDDILIYMEDIQATGDELTTILTQGKL
jgi:hypothetical protein